MLKMKKPPSVGGLIGKQVSGGWKVAKTYGHQEGDLLFGGKAERKGEKR